MKYLVKHRASNNHCKDNMNSALVDVAMLWCHDRYNWSNGFTDTYNTGPVAKKHWIPCRRLVVMLRTNLTFFFFETARPTYLSCSHEVHFYQNRTNDGSELRIGHAPEVTLRGRFILFRLIKHLIIFFQKQLGPNLTYLWSTWPPLNVYKSWLLAQNWPWFRGQLI